MYDVEELNMVILIFFPTFFKSLIFNVSNASRNNFQATFSVIETWKSQVLMSQWLIFLVMQLKS